MRNLRDAGIVSLATIGLVLCAGPAMANETESPKSDRQFSVEESQARSEKLLSDTLKRNGQAQKDLQLDPEMAQASSYPSPGGFGEGVNCLVDVGPIDCNTARNDANTAASEAQARYPDSISDGVGDAFRHCYWNGLMTIHIGSGQAKSVADNHEESTQGNPASSAMDLHNNQVGRDIGASAGDEAGAMNGCIAATTDGRLQTAP